MTTTHNISRRDFVKLCGAFSLAAAAPLSWVPVAEAAVGSSKAFKEMRLKMGTTVEITVRSASASQASEALEMAWAEMDRLAGIFDHHRPGTALSELNASGSLADPGLELLDVLAAAEKAYRQSGQSFDPTVLPLLRLIEERFQTGNKAPEAVELKETLKLVGFDGVSFNRSGVRLSRSGQQMSLDGLAKGYIVDRAGDKLRQAGIRNALINAGGDILALGGRSSGQGWRLGIQDPKDLERYLRVIELSDKAVATSGSYQIFYDPRHEFHHLLDPGTGRSAGRLVSASVVAGSTAWADAMSTAAFVRPEVLRTVTGVEGMLVTPNGAQNLSEGFKGLLA